MSQLPPPERSSAFTSAAFAAIRYVKQSLRVALLAIPAVRDYYYFKRSITNKVSLWQYIRFFIKRNKLVYWPMHKTSEVTHPQNIFVGINSNPGTRPGCYLQGNGGIHIGNYVHFASNIGIISANHDKYDHTKHILGKVFIGDYTWIGQGALIMPNVRLGTRTIVGAGSVVTHSFPEGYCVIAGNPARKIQNLDPEKFIATKYQSEYYGFIPVRKFKKFAGKRLAARSYSIPEQN